MVASYFSKLKVGIMHIITIRHSFIKEDIETAGFRQITVDKEEVECFNHIKVDMEAVDIEAAGYMIFKVFIKLVYYFIIIMEATIKVVNYLKAFSFINTVK